MLSPATLANIARIVATMSAEAGAYFRSGFDAAVSKVGERAAISEGFKALNAAYQRGKEGWEKRSEAPQQVREDARVFACNGCGTIQPKCACHACGETGPGVCCFYCGSSVRPGTCPACHTLWKPVLVEQEERGLTLMPLLDIEFRATPKIGEIIGWANSSLKDAHRSIIPPEEVIKHLKPGITKIDEEHNKTEVPGVTIAEVWMAKRAVVNPATGVKEMVDGVGVRITCDRSIPEAAEFYNRFANLKKKNAYTGLSIGFYPEEEAYEAWRSGKTDTIAKIVSIPWLSAVAKPSNSGADVLELRSATALTRDEQPASDAPPAKQPAAPAPEDPAAVVPPMTELPAGSTLTPEGAQPQQHVTQTETGDILAEITKEVEAAGQPKESSPSAPDPKTAQPPVVPAVVQAPTASSSPETQPAAPAQELVATLSARLDSLTKTVEQLRAAPPLREWEADVTELKTRAAEYGSSLQGITDRLTAVADESRKKDASLERGIRGLFPLFSAHFEKRIAELKAPHPRVGSPGELDEISVAEAVRGADPTADQKELISDIEAAKLITKPL